MKLGVCLKHLQKSMEVITAVRLLEREGVADEVREVMENQSWLVLGVLVRICVFTLNKIRSHYRTDLHFKSASLIAYL